MLLDECIPLQGRVIVLPKETRQLQLHEICVDSHDAQWDEETGELSQRGNFSAVAESFSSLKHAGVNATILTGATERDCGDLIYHTDGDLEYRNPNASPYASVYRAAPCSLLGGVGGFMEVMQEARRVGMKVLVEISSSVSASHPHRRYSPLLLHFEDGEGKKQVFYGGDNRGLLPQEMAVLNFRKLETWQLFVDDVKLWFKKFGIDGVRIANAQEVPQLLCVDTTALSRKDADGQFHYAAQDIVMGEVIVPHSSSLAGYWSLASLAAFASSPCSSFRSVSSLAPLPGRLSYANPFYIKLCRSIWLESPDFFIIGECWDQLQQLRHLQDAYLYYSSSLPSSSSLMPFSPSPAAVAGGGGGGVLGTGGACREDALFNAHLPSEGSCWYNESLLLSSLAPSAQSIVPSLLAISGVLPQMYLLPNLLPSLLGKRQPLIPVCPSSTPPRRERTFEEGEEAAGDQKAWTGRGDTSVSFSFKGEEKNREQQRQSRPEWEANLSIRDIQGKIPVYSISPSFLFSALFAINQFLPRGSILLQVSSTPPTCSRTFFAHADTHSFSLSLSLSCPFFLSFFLSLSPQVT
ncbi:glycogen [Cystoisospora suis]|uniref:Glycogen n=1 Tax=Cystoisospora suis TaxID=483139 RepID=A0A2C6KNH4_9APIC|nr:glycogen [Cystoisospora suis]